MPGAATSCVQADEDARRSEGRYQEALFGRRARYAQVLGGEVVRTSSELKRKHSAALRARLQPEHDALVRKAAETAGISISDWVRERLLAAARRELRL